MAKAKAKASSSRRSAAAKLATPPKELPDDATLMDKLEADSSVSDKKGSKKRLRSVSQVVCKQLRDHFAGWTSHQTDALLNPVGKTLRQVLTEDRLAIERGDGDAPVLGKNYYAKKMDEFTYTESPYKLLKVANDSQVVDPDLLAGLEAVNTHPRSFEAITDFFLNGEELNQKSLTLLYRQCLKLSPNGSPEVLAMLQDTLKYSHKHRIAEKYPVEFKAVKQHFDDVLVRSLQQWKAAGLHLKMWWDGVKDYVSDVVPVDAFSACLAEVGEWRDVENQLCEIVFSSAVGNRAFGLAWRQLQGNKVTKFVDGVLHKLFEAEITPTSLDVARASFLKLVADTGRNPKEVQPKRDAVVSYRGCKVKVPVHSFYDEWLMHESAAVEGNAVDQGKLEALSVESDLVTPGRNLITVEISEEVLRDAVKVRRAAAEVLKDPTLSGEGIVAALTAKSHVLSPLSKGWRVLYSFFQCQTGDGAQDRLIMEVLRFLPKKGQATIKMQESVAKLDQLSKGKLIRFMGVGQQARFGTARQFVADLMAKKTPKFDGKNDCSFMRKVMEACSHWLVHPSLGETEQPRSAGSDDKSVATKRLTGKDAAAAKYDALAEIAAKSVPKLSDVTELQVFGWLLSAEQKSKLEVWTNASIKADIVTAAATAVSSGKGKSKGKGGRKKVAPSARDLVLSMLDD